jgi:hypothetical protein
MKLIISQSQLKNITQKVISEQFSNPEDYSFKNILTKQKEAARPLNPGEGIYLKGKGWWSGTPLEVFMNSHEGLQSYKNEPAGIVYITAGNEDWNFSMDGTFTIEDNKNGYNTTDTGIWKYDGSGNVVIRLSNGKTYNSSTNQWTDPNANCASSLDEIKEGSIKILKYGCKNDAVKELQKLLGMEEKYQTGFFGPITKGKVTEFQTSKGLKVDGVVGFNTYGALTTQTTEPEKTDTSGLGVDDDIDQFNKQTTEPQKINESINTLKKVFNKLK